MTESRVTRVFISYSRRDKSFAKKILEELTSRGMSAYLDEKDIEIAERWWDRLRELILDSDVVLFLISPDSVVSEVCANEVELASDLSKRILPVVVRDTDNDLIPPGLSELNYSFCRTDEEITQQIPSIENAINKDIHWVRDYTKWTRKYDEWFQNEKHSSYLLGMQDTEKANIWLGKGETEACKIEELVEASKEHHEKQKKLNIKRQREAFEAQASYYSEKSISCLNENDLVGAVNYALEASPDPGSTDKELREKPYSANTLKALSEVIHSFQTKEFMPESVRESDRIWMSPNGKAYICTWKNELNLVRTFVPDADILSVNFGHSIHSVAFDKSATRVAVLLEDQSLRVLDTDELKILHSTQLVFLPHKSFFLAGARYVTLLGPVNFRLFDTNESNFVDLNFRDQSSPFNELSNYIELAPGARGKEVAIPQEFFEKHKSDYVTATALGNNFCIQCHGTSVQILCTETLEKKSSLQIGGEAVDIRVSQNSEYFCIRYIRNQQSYCVAFGFQNGDVAKVCEVQADHFCLSDSGHFAFYSDKNVELVHQTQSRRSFEFEQDFQIYAQRRDLLLTLSHAGEWLGVIHGKEYSPDSIPKKASATILKSSNYAHCGRSFSQFDAEGVFGMVWSSSGRLVAVYGHSREVQVLDFEGETFSKRHALYHDSYAMEDGVRCAEFSNDNRYLVTGSCDRQMKLWDLRTGKELRSFPHVAGVKRVSISDDCALLCSIDDYGKARVFLFDGYEISCSEDSFQFMKPQFTRQNNVLLVNQKNEIVVLRLACGELASEVIRLAPRGWDKIERVKAALPDRIPEWCLRSRKYPALTGHEHDGSSLGAMLDSLRSVVVDRGMRAFLDILYCFEHEDPNELTAVALAIWADRMSLLESYFSTHNLGAGNHNFQIAAEAFVALLKAADKTHGKDLCKIMCESYRGPRITEMNKWS